MKERTDGEILDGLIERSRLLIALSDEIPVTTKLETQPLLKQLEQLVDDSATAPDLERIEATHALLCEALAEFADLDALLSAMRHFLPR
jgi:pectin methylesterase-like acyl-CoA thioesterase